MEIKIKKDTTSKKDRYYTVITNKHSRFYDSKIIFGSSENTVKNKAEKQLKKWDKEAQ